VTIGRPVLTAVLPGGGGGGGMGKICGGSVNNTNKYKIYERIGLSTKIAID